MKLSVQVIVHPDDDGEGSPVVREVFALDRDGVAPDTLGLRLAEAKDLLVAVQDTMVAHQVSTAVAAEVACPRCGRLAGTRITTRSWSAACSARCACPVPAGGTARARLRPPGPSGPWPSCCPSGPRLS